LAPLLTFRSAMGLNTRITATTMLSRVWRPELSQRAATRFRIVKAPRPGSAFGAQRKGTYEFLLKQTIRDRHAPRKTTRPIKMICPSPFGSNRSGLCRKRNTPCKFAALASAVAKHTRSSRMAWQIAGRGPGPCQSARKEPPSNLTEETSRHVQSSPSS
jgi:hypothetical protein